MEARVALGAIRGLDSSSSEHFSPVAMAPECKGLGRCRCQSVGSAGPMATLTSVSDKRSILARWRARDSCADRSPISGHRSIFSGYSMPQNPSDASTSLRGS
jgi:hypothetical protein